MEEDTEHGMEFHDSGIGFDLHRNGLNDSFIRNPSPESCQTYFVDKMKLLKLKLKKSEEEKRILYQCLEEKEDERRNAIKDKHFIINNFHTQLDDVRKSLEFLVEILKLKESSEMEMTALKILISNNADPVEQALKRESAALEIVPFQMSEPEKIVMMQKNKTLEENFKKELKRIKKLEKEIENLNESLEEVEREREELLERNIFVEEENGILREKIDESRVFENSASQTDLEGTHLDGYETHLESIKVENLEEITCLAQKINNLQFEYDDLQLKYQNKEENCEQLVTEKENLKELVGDLEWKINTLTLINKCLVNTCQCGLMINGNTGATNSCYLLPNKEKNSSMKKAEEKISTKEDDMEVGLYIQKVKNRRQKEFDTRRGC